MAIIGITLSFASMSHYIFDTNIPDREYHRLRLLEDAHDPRTIRLLNTIGIQPGWACLELGPGAGSILQWMGERVGNQGLVMGVDKNSSYLDRFSHPPYLIQSGNFLDVPIETSFDLVHCRFVLIHNPEQEKILEKILQLLKPGGLALLEEPDFSSPQLMDTDVDDPQARVNSAICQMFVDLGLDPAYGLHLPPSLQSQGFHILDIQSALHLCPGNSPLANVMAESASALTQHYCQTGKCTESDIQHYITNAHTSDRWSIYHSTISIIAQRPLEGT